MFFRNAFRIHELMPKSRYPHNSAELVKHCSEDCVACAANPPIVFVPARTRMHWDDEEPDPPDQPDQQAAATAATAMDVGFERDTCLVLNCNGGSYCDCVGTCTVPRSGVQKRVTPWGYQSNLPATDPEMGHVINATVKRGCS